ncbi:MAG TPA: molecular chaperone TorD family protein [Bryobacteraceae bacterium]|nr:molecular chaperone TorD family protein [Bryobacteraceae bacterium]HOL72053.1 molecular chaperone TorD family protein [Bryobacteraceae bacterium]HOQ46655.1 molecular chaperone TorD family protein [Bryobacteraceae bacterium]HPU72325.1 molecular chaperone TorD family protein [Bryobacteraceae bacterium]
MTYEELADRLHYPDEPAMQELYIQTFEFNPACTLEIGWHLFGENYERGEFLVRMRGLLRQHGIAETTELPDHLTHVLQLIGRMEPGEAARLVGEAVLPALEKIRLPDDNPYREVLDTVREKLTADFPNAPRRSPQLPILQKARL